MEEITGEILRFVEERDWFQFHSPRNLAAAINVEAGELLENFIWENPTFEELKKDRKRRQRVEEELSDIMIYALEMFHNLGTHPWDAIARKIEKTDRNTPWNSPGDEQTNTQICSKQKKTLKVEGGGDVKIYFAGSIRSGGQEAENYRHVYARTIETLRRYGTVLTEHVGNEEKLAMENTLTDREIHDRDIRWLMEADVLVADVTVPSTGVGYEIGRAVEHHKPVLCLYQPDPEKKLSAMIGGCPDIVLREYHSHIDVEKAIEEFFSTLKT